MITSGKFTALCDDIWCIDALYTGPEIACCYLVGDSGEYALIETGTARSLDNILASLDTIGVTASQLRYVIPTHVHLDHAGCAGQLMRAFPQATLLIHPRGARHMIDPSRLVASSLQVYGEATFARLYGEILPVDAGRVRTLEDGEVVMLGQRPLLIAHTRGHADHHFCLFDERSRGWFSGDMFGISYPRLRFRDGAFLMPATTPTQFDPDLYGQSLDRLAAQRPERCYLTHFSVLEFEPAQVTLLQAQLSRYRELGRHGESPEAIQSAVQQITRDMLATVTDPETAAAQAESLNMDAALNAQGIHWWRGQNARTAAP